MHTSRRGFLAAAGTGLAALAGCSAPSSDSHTPVSSEGEPFAALYEATSPSVVRIRVYGVDGPSSQGSGWMYDDGVVVTNAHVVDGAETIRVQFAEGEWRKATLLGSDAYSDLAALSVSRPPSYAEPLPFVDEQPPVGTRVAAFGAPLGLGGSLTTGIVSGQDRSLQTVEQYTVADAVQTDAALNPGNSGGPLVTLDGEVAGVVTQAGGENVGFAISAALTQRVVPELIATGEYDHPLLGVLIRPVTPLLAKANDLRAVRGVYVDNAMTGGPAGGVLEGSTGEETVEGAPQPVGGDVIVRLGDQPIETMADLGTYLALETSPGDTIQVGIWRDGETRTVSFELGTRPAPSA